MYNHRRKIERKPTVLSDGNRDGHDLIVSLKESEAQISKAIREANIAWDRESSWKKWLPMYAYGIAICFLAEGIVYQIAQTRPIFDVAVCFGLVITLVFIVVGFCGTHRFYQDRPGFIRALIVPIAATVGVYAGLLAASYARTVSFYQQWSPSTTYHSSAEGYNVFTLDPSARFNISALQVWPLPNEGTLCLAPIAFTPDTGKQQLETPEHTYRYWSVDFNCCASVPVSDPAPSKTPKTVTKAASRASSHLEHTDLLDHTDQFMLHDDSSHELDSSLHYSHPHLDEPSFLETSSQINSHSHGTSSVRDKPVVSSTGGEIAAIVPASMTEEQRRTIAVVAVAAAHAAKGGVDEVVAVTPSSSKKQSSSAGAAGSSSLTKHVNGTKNPTSPISSSEAMSDVKSASVKPGGETTLVAKLQAQLKAEQEKEAKQDQIDKEKEEAQSQIENAILPDPSIVPVGPTVSSASNSAETASQTSVSQDPVSSQLEATLATVGAKSHRKADGGATSASSQKTPSLGAETSNSKSASNTSPVSTESLKATSSLEQSTKTSVSGGHVETDRVKRVKKELREKSKKSIAHDAAAATLAAVAAASTSSAPIPVPVPVPIVTPVASVPPLIPDISTSSIGSSKQETAVSVHATDKASEHSEKSAGNSALAINPTVPTIPHLLSEDKVANVIQTDNVKLEPVLSLPTDTGVSESVGTQASNTADATEAHNSRLVPKLDRLKTKTQTPSSKHVHVDPVVREKIRQKEKQKRKHERKQKRVLIQLPESGDVAAAVVSVASTSVTTPQSNPTNSDEKSAAAQLKVVNPHQYATVEHHASPHHSQKDLNSSPHASISRTDAPLASHTDRETAPLSALTPSTQSASQSTRLNESPNSAPAAAPALIAAAPTSSPLSSVRMVSVATCPGIVTTGVSRDAVRLKPQQVWGDALGALRKLDPYVRIPPDAVFLQVSEAGSAMKSLQDARRSAALVSLSLPFLWPILALVLWIVWGCATSCYANQGSHRGRGKAKTSYRGLFDSFAALPFASFALAAIRTSRPDVGMSAHALSKDSQENMQAPQETGTQDTTSTKVTSKDAFRDTDKEFYDDDYAMYNTVTDENEQDNNFDYDVDYEEEDGDHEDEDESEEEDGSDNEEDGEYGEAYGAEESADTAAPSSLVSADR